MIHFQFEIDTHNISKEYVYNFYCMRLKEFKAMVKKTSSRMIANKKMRIGGRTFELKKVVEYLTDNLCVSEFNNSYAFTISVKGSNPFDETKKADLILRMVEFGDEYNRPLNIFNKSFFKMNREAEKTFRVLYRGETVR